MRTSFFITFFSLLLFFCSAQEGFRKELPLDLLQPDTPYTFIEYEDFQVIEYSPEDTQITYCAKVDQSGQELFSVSNYSEDPQYNAFNYSGKYFYYPERHLQVKKYYYPNRKEYSISIFSFNSKGQKIKLEIFRSNNLPTWIQEHLWTYEYDGNGNIIEVTSIDSRSVKILTKTTYDSKGRQLKKMTYQSLPAFEGIQEATTDQLIRIVDYEYFNDKYIMKKVAYDYNLISVDTIYVNKRNQPIELRGWRKEVYPGSENNVLQFHSNILFEYDSKGRTIKLTRIQNILNSLSTSITKYKYANKNVPDLIPFKDDF